MLVLESSLKDLGPSLCWHGSYVLRLHPQQVAMRSHEDTCAQSFIEQRDIPPHTVNVLGSVVVNYYNKHTS